MRFWHVFPKESPHEPTSPSVFFDTDFCHCAIVHSNWFCWFFLRGRSWFFLRGRRPLCGDVLFLLCCLFDFSHLLRSNLRCLQFVLRHLFFSCSFLLLRCNPGSCLLCTLLCLCNFMSCLLLLAFFLLLPLPAPRLFLASSAFFLASSFAFSAASAAFFRAASFAAASAAALRRASSAAASSAFFLAAAS